MSEQTPKPLAADDVEWVVNDNAELGVKIGNQFFWLYKGHSLVYDDGKHDDGSPMHWRPVFKREFGECAHPINYSNPARIGTVSLTDSDDWQELPPVMAGETPAPQEPNCAWPGCAEPALCTSGNFGGQAVCRDHFAITNGRAPQEPTDTQQVAMLKSLLFDERAKNTRFRAALLNLIESHGAARAEAPRMFQVATQNSEVSRGAGQ